MTLAGAGGVAAAVAFATLVPLLIGQLPPSTWNDLIAEGQHAAAGHDYARAEQYYLKALHEAERFAADDWRIGATLEGLGQAFRFEKKFGDAEQAFNRARSILEKTNGPESLEISALNMDVAGVLLDAGHPADAIPLLRSTVSLYEGQLGGTDTRTADALCLLGDALRAAKNLPDAETALKRCLDIRQSDGGVDSPEFADALYSLAMTYSGEAKYALADPRFTLVEKIREKTSGITSPALAQTLEDHASVLKSMGRGQEAAKLLAMAGAIRRSGNRAGR